MPSTEFISTGSYVPDRVVTNAELAELMDTSDEWIQQRTGIRERHWVEENEGVGGSDLAKVAAQRALEKADLKVEDIDAIVYATLSPDHLFPGSACFLQEKLGLPGVPALDIRNQCSGFLYGLSIADAWIRGGVYKRVLLVGAEVQSSGLDISNEGRDVSVIFGDGAGAVLLGPTEEDRGVLDIRIGADGRYANSLWTEFPSSKNHPQYSEAIMAERRQFPQMNGSKVFKHAVSRMPKICAEVMEAVGFTSKDVRLFIPHQANLRISEMVQKTLEFEDHQVFNNIMEYGNTTAASIPLALDQALDQGRLERGEMLLIAAFGAGFTWGAAAIRW